ncbi:DUF6128 domain-containing protein [Lacrimispora defluvii]|uniref:DUF6128 domain-containing protein n=1 Tax=Lacrimispora defluvii TaxID=2719233 RepID=A0ABX1W066_9FIRM|nr:DUF6128 domain-containing protein [Lacrimispora defluvii]NNJ33065.1 hypothetical protein [Lacrimispora defluvii]
MSNYRRLISYIYAYEGGVKGKNIGFAKIETRGIQCKITVSVKRIYVGGNDIGVYLLAGEQEIYLGNIFIRGGSGEFRATVSVNDIERSGYNMDQCFGLTIHDVKNTWRSYTTIWEDAVAHAAAVDLENTDSAVRENSAISEEQIKKAVQEIEKEFPLEDGDSQDTKNEEEVLLKAESPVSSDSEPSPEAESLRPEIQQMTGSIPQDGNTRTTVTGPTAGGRQGNPPSVTAPAPDRQQNTRPTMTGPIPGWWQEPRPTGPMPTAPMPNGSMPTAPIPNGAMPRSRPTGPMPGGTMPTGPTPRPTGPMPTAPMSAESLHTDPTEEAQTILQSQQESVPLMPKPMMSQAEDGGLKESVQMSSGDAGLAEDADVFLEPEAGTTRLYRADALIKETKNQDHTEPTLGDPEVLEHLRQNESQEENQHSAIWEKLRKEHTRILAFDYEDGCEILTIKPQDIGLLPRDAWVFGNNSFLLHGYYNYRYLILARLNTEGTPRYLLGVPGHYYSNERYMASMFGFPNFVLSKDQPMEDGRFGFWYTDIKVGG